MGQDLLAPVTLVNSTLCVDPYQTALGVGDFLQQNTVQVMLLVLIKREGKGGVLREHRKSLDRLDN